MNPVFLGFMFLYELLIHPQTVYTFYQIVYFS